MVPASHVTGPPERRARVGSGSALDQGHPGRFKDERGRGHGRRLPGLLSPADFDLVTAAGRDLAQGRHTAQFALPHRAEPVVDDEAVTAAAVATGRGRGGGGGGGGVQGRPHVDGHGFAARPRRRGGRGAGGVTQLEDAGAAHDAAERQGALSHGHLDGADETLAAHHAVLAGERLHGGARSQAHHALATEGTENKVMHQHTTVW